MLFDRKENGLGIDYSQRRISSASGLVIAVLEGLETEKLYLGKREVRLSQDGSREKEAESSNNYEKR